MRLMLVAGLALFAIASVPGGVVAQAAGSRDITPGQNALIAAAHLRLTPGPRFHSESPLAGLVRDQSRSDKRQGEILMIVGAAGIVTGLLVDEDLVTIAGAAVGGFGLYLYLKATR